MRIGQAFTALRVPLCSQFPRRLRVRGLCPPCQTHEIVTLNIPLYRERLDLA